MDSWVAFYEEFADKLLLYEDRRKDLIAILISIHEKIGMKFPTMESTGFPHDVDPFTVFGLFNKGINNGNRINMLHEIKREFHVGEKVPVNFDGIPVLTNLKATFFSFIEERGKNDIDNLWKIFKVALANADNPTEELEENFVKLYDVVSAQRGIKWNLSIGLFWVRPNAYLNLDETNRVFLKSFEYDIKRPPRGDEYLKICHSIKKKIEDKTFPCMSFVDISKNAWRGRLVSKDTEYWPSCDIYSPDIDVSSWIKFLHNDKEYNPKTFEMLNTMLALGGESTCNNLKSVLGGTANEWNNRGKYLGKRVSESLNIEPYGENDNKYFPIPFVGRKVVEDGKRRYSWKLREEVKEALRIMQEKNNELMGDKNIILYGPPGTGKTYNTVLYALSIIERKHFSNLKDEDYIDCINRYKKYKEKGLIESVTFHQSYGYEEFIEGIKPVFDSTEESDKKVQYKIEKGIFYSFCERAKTPELVNGNDNDRMLKESQNIWKVSLERTGDNETRKECMENGHIRIGWDEYGENLDHLQSYYLGGQNVLNAFENRMQRGDIVLSCYSATTIDAIGIITGDYEWHDEYEHFKRLRKVDWLVKGIKEDILSINKGKSLTLATVYSLNIKTNDVYEIVKKYSNKIYRKNSNNYVFIIDEINRGNISKIFGELITLIEPEKRLGQIEGMEVKLPYSGDSFGVPENVYIIGTMNTADRSIATLDTALRRRFSFIEMGPDCELISGINVDGINIGSMLKKINERIEVLYDREHMIGHAYFMPLKENPSMVFLRKIFLNKIIPLLQEYFYEDYEKIRLVLNDNEKSEENQFIKKTSIDGKLFGDAWNGYDEQVIYSINKESFDKTESYRMIYEKQ